jgi:hypothetical protein
MIRKGTLVLAGAMLALGCASLQAAITVGYYTDYNTGSTGPNAPIVANGYTAVQITDITTFNLSTIKILMIDESANGSPSAALLSQATAISNWVNGGGIVAIHDRNVCAGTCTPVPGSAGISFVRSPGTVINVQTGGTLVTNGPFGVIDNTTLGGGNYSDHGYSGFTTLPGGAVGILNNGTPNNMVAYTYRFGSGWVYYSTIPLDYYLDNNGSVPGFKNIYAPNMLAYLGSLSTGPTVGTVPTLSEWGLGILAILLMGCGVLMLKSGATEGAGNATLAS